MNRDVVLPQFDGIVLTRGAEVGQLASPGGAPLFRLGRAGGIEMRGNVAERDLPRLAVGQPASVRVTGVEQAFPGKIRLIGAVIDPQTRLGSVRVDLVPHKDLRPGAFARGEISVGKASRPIIPQTAVMSDADGNYVFIVDLEGHREETHVARAITELEQRCPVVRVFGSYPRAQKLETRS